ncbi:MAG: TetR/AcrR family transcriptional regulator [Paludibacteraceae bacterium]|nr:TetR/AcrR family transcriptional regulator [Paludibacteraceae bacterium]
MPRKVQFSREMIIDAAIEMIRAQGGESINARDLGLRIGCSSRPLFTAFKNMNELIDVVRKEASERFLRYMKVAEETDNGEPVSKRMGMRIVQFAYEEPNLYKFIHWSGSSMPDVATLSEIIAAQYMRDYQLTHDEANVFFRQMMIFSLGLCSMITHKVYNFSSDEIEYLLHTQFAATLAHFKQNGCSAESKGGTL